MEYDHIVLQFIYLTSETSSVYEEFKDEQK